MATDTPMQLGMVGLGRMGSNLVRRLMRDGHRCVVYDVNPEAVKQLDAEGATGATSLQELRGQAGTTPRGVADAAGGHCRLDPRAARPAAGAR